MNTVANRLAGNSNIYATILPSKPLRLFFFSIDNKKFIKQLDDISYSTAIYKISSQNTEFINKNQKILIKKIEYAKTAYLLTFFVIGFATTSSVLFLLYKVIL